MRTFLRLGALVDVLTPSDGDCVLAPEEETEEEGDDALAAAAAAMAERNSGERKYFSVALSMGISFCATPIHPSR